MNRLPARRRAEILSLLVEGASLRAIARHTGASINTITKLLVDAGNACAAFHDEHVRGVRAARVQADEIWSFTYAKARNVEKAKKAPAGAGDTWTWTAIDADSKLMISWLVGQRDGQAAYQFMTDLAGRLAGRVQLTSDGLGLYLEAVEAAFGMDVDYAQLVKVYGAEPLPEQRRYSTPPCKAATPRRIQGAPNPAHISTSFVERHNLTMRMSIRRFTRLTNAFSKKFENHAHHTALYAVWYNWCRRHATTRLTPAQAAGLTETWRDVDWLAGEVDARTPPPAKPGPAKGAKYRPRRKT